MIKLICNIMANSFDRGISGYTSFSDFFSTLIKVSYLKFNFIAVTIAALPTFITSYVYNDEKAIYILFLLFVLDLITGVWKSLRKGTFSSYKLARWLPQMIFAFVLLSIGWHLSTISYLYALLPTVIYGFVSSTLFISVIENLGELGIIDSELIKVLKDRFGVKSILKKFKKEE